MTYPSITTVPPLAEIRRMTGLSQAAFAERYGIPRRSIENWESGSRTPPPYIIKLIYFAVINDVVK